MTFTLYFMPGVLHSRIALVWVSGSALTTFVFRHSGKINGDVHHWFHSRALFTELGVGMSSVLDGVRFSDVRVAMFGSLPRVALYWCRVPHVNHCTNHFFFAPLEDLALICTLLFQLLGFRCGVRNGGVCFCCVRCNLDIVLFVHYSITLPFGRVERFLAISTKDRKHRTVEEGRDASGTVSARFFSRRNIVWYCSRTQHTPWEELRASYVGKFFTVALHSYGCRVLHFSHGTSLRHFWISGESWLRRSSFHLH